MSVEADLLKECEMFHVFDNCILQLEVQRKLATQGGPFLQGKSEKPS